MNPLSLSVRVCVRVRVLCVVCDWSKAQGTMRAKLQILVDRLDRAQAFVAENTNETGVTGDSLVDGASAASHSVHSNYSTHFGTPQAQEGGHQSHSQKILEGLRRNLVKHHEGGPRAQELALQAQQQEERLARDYEQQQKSAGQEILKQVKALRGDNGRSSSSYSSSSSATVEGIGLRLFENALKVSR